MDEGRGNAGLRAFLLPLRNEIYAKTGEGAFQGGRIREDNAERGYRRTNAGIARQQSWMRIEENVRPVG